MEENNSGVIRISDEVVADIAIRAALDVEGVSSVHQRFTFGKSVSEARPNVVKGVAFSVAEDGGLELSLQISVLFGKKVPEVCALVQEEVIDAVTSMTGMTVCAVNVVVVSVAVPRPTKKSVKAK